MMTWTKWHRRSWQDWRTQQKEDEASQVPKDDVNHDDGANANQVTSASILNIANIRINNNTTIMVSDMPSKHELHGQIKNKRNIRDMKRVRRKSALSSYRNRGSIGGMNNAMVRRGS
jgi:hypothetical protein